MRIPYSELLEWDYLDIAYFVAIEETDPLDNPTQRQGVNNYITARSAGCKVNPKDFFKQAKQKSLTDKELQLIMKGMACG